MLGFTIINSNHEKQLFVMKSVNVVTCCDIIVLPLKGYVEILQAKQAEFTFVTAFLKICT